MYWVLAFSHQFVELFKMNVLSIRTSDGVQRISSYKAQKRVIFQHSFLIFSKSWCFFACASLLLVPGWFACTIGLYSARRFSKIGHSRLCEVCAGAWIARGTSSWPESESVIVIESESESVSAIVSKVAYAKKICSGVVGWLSIFPDVSLYRRTHLLQSKICLLFLYVLLCYLVLCLIVWSCHIGSSIVLKGTIPQPSMRV